MTVKCEIALINSCNQPRRIKYNNEKYTRRNKTRSDCLFRQLSLSKVELTLDQCPDKIWHNRYEIAIGNSCVSSLWILSINTHHVSQKRFFFLILMTFIQMLILTIMIMIMFYVLVHTKSVIGCSWSVQTWNHRRQIWNGHNDPVSM